MELTITKQTLPEVDFNKEALQEFANEVTKRYENLVFAPEDVTIAKKTRADLNSLIKKIDHKRLEVMKEMSEPLAEFEKTMKDVAKQIKETSAAIDVQIKNFEESEKEEKRTKVLELIDMTVAEYKLDEKHASQLTINEKYLNKSETVPKIMTDLKNRAEVLKNAQTKVESDRNLVIQTCELHKEHFNVDVESYLMLLESGRDVAEIVSMINQKAQAERERKFEEERQQMQAEIEKKQAELQQKLSEPIPEPTVHIEPIKLSQEVQSEPQITWELRITGGQSQWKLLGDIVKRSGMQVEWLKQIVGIEEVI